jgi:hypothetical protein
MSFLSTITYHDDPDWLDAWLLEIEWAYLVQNFVLCELNVNVSFVYDRELIAYIWDNKVD